MKILKRNKLTGRKAKVFVQSFETAACASSTARSTCRWWR